MFIKHYEHICAGSKGITLKGYVLSSFDKRHEDETDYLCALAQVIIVVRVQDNSA